MTKKEFIEICAEIDEIERRFAVLDPSNNLESQELERLSFRYSALSDKLIEAKKALWAETSERDRKIIHAYQDRIFATSQKQLFILLHDMRFGTKRQYHPTGEITIHLDKQMADRLEAIFEEQPF